ncbi:NUDIX hydrolase [Actinopolymorpha rutila]|uniref:NUDIX hydrolase n=1 Tax=Actinopolymorpha rutila TaxID=446787 RepID=UPI003B515614
MSPTREAAGVAVFSPDGHLLLGRHAHDGRWATIGGAVEPGETPREPPYARCVRKSASICSPSTRWGASPARNLRRPVSERRRGEVCGHQRPNHCSGRTPRTSPPR